MNIVTKQNLRAFLFVIVILFILMLVYGGRLHRAITDDNSSLPLISRLLGEDSTPEIVYKAEKTIRVLEGWTTRDISQYFEREGWWQSEELLELIGFPLVDYRKEKEIPLPKDFSDQFSFLEDKPKHRGLEGYLFPDTYRVFDDAVVEDAVLRMLENFDSKLTPELRTEIERQGKTIYEIVTMASIIEKEAPVTASDDYDARVISGIFWYRLKIGQALQSDATLSYLFGDTKPAHSGKELEDDSLYNSYKYRGLPPGPIANPGITAIKAAIYPIDTNYNFFLTPKDSQEVIYASTYEQHLQNKYKYLR